MRFRNILVLVFAFTTLSFATDDIIDINFKNLQIDEFIKITSKIIDKNILTKQNIGGKVDFVSDKPVKKDDILNILTDTLESKGFTIVEKDDILIVVKTSDVKNNIVKKSTQIVQLKNADAKNITLILNGLIKNKHYKNPTEKSYISSDEESNSVILMGLLDEIEHYKKIINQLDNDKQQVYVQAKIIEVSENKTKDVGIKYGIDGFKATNSGLATFSSTLNGGTSSLANIGNFGGLDFNTIKDGIALGVTVNLLNLNGAADIVSEPSLLCLNNKASSIYVGETRSIKTGSTFSSGTTTSGNVVDNFTREEIGLTLKVKPRISDGEKVALEINTKLEDFEESTTNGQPNTTKKDIATTAIVNNGESIILGGYIREKKSKIQSKIPLLGDIPFFGYLFKNELEVSDKINLVIIITPYIIPKSKDLTYVRNQLSELKILEDKYTKDTILRLEEMKIKEKKENIARDEKHLLLKDTKDK